MKQLSLFLFFTLLIFALPELRAQRGLPPIRNYSTKEYKAFPQNWAITQDTRGVMYFGNGRGILEYNGTKWRRFFTKNKTTVLSMAADASGKIFIGAEGEVGYLGPDSTGEMKFHSLMHKVAEKDMNFTYVWATYASNEGICFASSENILIWDGTNMKAIYPKKIFFTSFCVNGKFYVSEQSSGIYVLEKGKLNLLPGTAEIANVGIRSILDYGNSQLLIATGASGCYIHDGKNLSVLKTELNDYFKTKNLYKGIRLPNGDYAFSTTTAGIAIMSKEGKLLQTLDESNGIINKSVYALFVDRENELWLGTENGISRVEISSPLTYYDKRNGLTGLVKAITETADGIYVSTLQGLYKLNKATNTFELQHNITFQVFSAVKFDKGMVALLSEVGAVEIINNKQNPILHANYVLSAFQSLKDPSVLYLGGLNEFYVYKKTKDKWNKVFYKDSIDAEMQSIVEDTDGSVWLGNTSNNLFHAIPENEKNWLIEAYDSSSGLPQGIKEVCLLDGRMHISTEEGVFVFNRKNKKFERDNVYTPILKKTEAKYAFLINKDSIQNYWALTGTGIGYIPAGKSTEWYNTPFKRLNFTDYYSISHTSGGTFIGGTDGLILYKKEKAKNLSLKFNALITMVYNSTDTFFKGTFYDSDKNISLSQLPSLTPSFSYKNNGLIFEYSSPFFDDEQATTYSYFLEGFDSTWSAPTKEIKKEYTNLPEGNYIFHVKAVNIYGNESSESVYKFIIQTPWYRTWLAYALYITFSALILWRFIKWRESKLKKENELLEAKVKERTEKLAEANEELNQQNEEISAQRDEIESQKHLVEEKSEQLEEALKDITDSINYAQRIQRALLASKELLSTNLKDFFIFFQPKDIVSGDFYWAADLNDKQFALVTADSTGHGVPGAIMSMLNISCLNEAIGEKKLTHPAEILNYTRSRIIQHLSNDGSDTGGKDGMDCSILVINFGERILKYAAANNPVWIVRKMESSNQCELLEFAPDKMPVGKHDRDNVSFTQHEVKLQKEDMIYTLTDGLPDQFGGPKGKKFMYRQLKEMLLNISSLPVHEQKEILKNALNQWKGELQQVDDICVIGIRVD